MEWNKLEERIKSKCSHNYGGREVICIPVTEILENAVTKGIEIPLYIMDLYWKYFMVSGYCYTRCYSRNNVDIFNRFLELLYTKQVPSLAVLEIIIKRQKFQYFYHALLKNDNFQEMCGEALQLFVNKLKHEYSSEYKKFEEDMVRTRVQIDNETLEKLVLMKSDNITELVSSYIDNNLKDVMTCDRFKYIVNNMCENIDYHNHSFSKFVKNGYTVTEGNSGDICYHGNLKSMNTLFQLSRVPITRIHFTSVLTSERTRLTIDTYYSSSSEYTVKRYKMYDKNKLELLFKYGYKLSQNDFMALIRHRIGVDDIKRFDIKLDRKVLEACERENFFPTYDFGFIDPDLVRLRQLTREKNVDSIRKFYKDKSIVPDPVCMSRACSIYNNHPTYNILKKNGGKLTYDNIKQVARTVRNEFLSTVLNDYEEDAIKKDKEIEELKNTINEMRNQICKLKYPNRRQKYRDIVQNAQRVNKEIDNANLILDEKFKKSIQRMEKIRKKTVDTNPKTRVIEFNVTDDQIIKTQEDHQIKTPAPDKFKKIVKKVNGELTYSDIKIYLLKYFNDNGFVKGDVVELPIGILLLLNIKNGSQFAFRDIDKFITYMYV